jgi:bifunctional DNA-binding transcriptional regulator/antitoxin component of YhaV-PrlF toxin-antitoxin module
MMSDYIANVKYDEHSENYYIVLPDESVSNLGWNENDSVSWTDNGDGSFTVKKVENKVWVLVECVQQHRMRYVVEAPADRPEFALDVVTMNQAKEFSQKDLGQTIVSHRVVSGAEALDICDEDNDYLKDWTDSKKIEVLFTKEGDDNYYDEEFTI